MLSLGSYLLGAAQVAAGGALAGFQRRIGCGSGCCRRGTGAPARLVEAIVAVALLIWISEILGTFGLLYAGSARRRLRCLPGVALAGGWRCGVSRGADAQRPAPGGCPHRQDPPARTAGVC